MRRLTPLLLLALLLAACGPRPPATPVIIFTSTPPATATLAPTPDYDATPLPPREPFGVGTVLPYEVQTGDTVVALAAHFNTTVDEILAVNPGLPLTTTLEPGLVLDIPAYWFPLGGSPYKIIPDSEFVYGPTSAGFDVDAYVQAQPGYLRSLSAFVAERHRTAGQAVEYVARTYSVSPRLLLALMEWRTGALTNPDAPEDVRQNPFGPIPGVRGFYAQMRHVAETLSVGYYGWRTGQLTTLLLRDDTRSRPDMYQTAGTVALHYLFAQWFGLEEFNQATSPSGFGSTFIRLWGNPFDRPLEEQVVLPGNFEQPELTLPFPDGQVWAFTGGPHPVWGDYLPWAALDFAPAGVSGCLNTERMVTAAAPGVIARSEGNIVVLDLDGDGYEQTGWALFHFHMSEFERIPAGTVVQLGDPLGHPSCEGGFATGTHVHLARKYNGEWIPADGVIPGVVPFVLGGWTAQKGEAPYLGRMMRIGAWIEACTCSTANNTVYWAK